MRRSVQPSRPSASTCCFLVSLKTLAIPAGDHTVPAQSTSRLSSYGRFSGVHVWPVLGVHRGPDLHRWEWSIRRCSLSDALVHWFDVVALGPARSCARDAKGGSVWRCSERGGLEALPLYHP